MQQAYHDIKDKLGEPLWYDEAGVPRYAEFHPTLANDVYAQEIALLEVACQHCGWHYQVALMGGGIMMHTPLNTLRWIDDPPEHGCPIGETESAEMLRVLQFWQRGENTGYEWRHVPSAESET